MNKILKNKEKKIKIFEEIVNFRKSTSKFKEDKIPKEILRRILELTQR
jgi:nitroreductase